MQFSIVTISSFVALLNQATKYIATNFIKKDVSKYIPVCSVIYGIILGVAGYFLTDVEMGGNIIEAIFIGAMSGSASTGVHQISKQLSPEKVQKIATVMAAVATDYEPTTDVEDETPVDDCIPEEEICGDVSDSE